ncbi:3-phosphoserine/phosphohydroxythreonine transaminase [Exiguobacterium sp. B2(2022)]|uniref:3-phosphoserine/phosphohydroxythreonine transaminase n=1 Tax=Exiguobacterium sp. B2(2022) TaxID=2992755 RepID=UPI00237BD6BB|nr:3-phosphoserine/phosphohydroxythreonine transaminase [Exiguobacterium sp. B2(2022)]MDE0564501.1 3-phosphoserine/phosphohydroxythreonine transaminase [Exiguobacterium sp. B2(2022)]
MSTYTYSAGPGMLPKEVMQEIQQHLLTFEYEGVSIIETSHRSDSFQQVVDSLEARLRRLMHIPENYAVLWLQGGATLQFSMIPMNLRNRNRFAYVDTGIWSKKAMEDARHFGQVEVIHPLIDEAGGMSFEPKLAQDVDYLHVTLNNTIEGTRFTTIPETDVPLIADASSNILAEQIDVERFGVIYAGAQKNIGPAGLTVVIIRRDLIQSMELPSYLHYGSHVDTLFNTPSTFSMYTAERVLKWVEDQGGVEAMERMNREKSDAVYSFLEHSNLFSSLVSGERRSLTNIPFTTGDRNRDKGFQQFALERGLLELGGHRSVGGLRASLYNAMPKEGAVRLVDVMRAFEEENHVSHQNI